MANAADNGHDAGRLSGDEAARLTEQVAALSQAGLPLPSGLRALGEEQPSRRLKGVLDRLADRLEAGEPLEQALGALGDRVPGHLRGLVASGVRTGKLSFVLGHYAEYATVGSDLRGGLLLELTYPLIVCCFGTALLGFLWGGIAYTFSNIYKDFGIPIPGLTRLIVGASWLIRRYWWIAADLLALTVAVALLCRVFLKPAERFSLFCRIPLVGRVWRWTALAEWCHLLALLIDSQLPLSDAVTLTGDGVGDAEIGRASRFVGRDIGAGLSLAQSLARAAIFPAGLERMLGWAERNRGLPEALHMAGELFESRARAQSSVIGAVVGIATFIAILLFVMLTVIALFLPMITLISKLSG